MGRVDIPEKREESCCVDVNGWRKRGKNRVNFVYIC
jgi:hypothetical protein